MHAWLCENPTGVDALQWKELPTPEPGRAGAHRDPRREPELPRHPDRAEQVPVQAALPFVPGSEYAGVIEAVGAASRT